MVTFARSFSFHLSGSANSTRTAAAHSRGGTLADRDETNSEQAVPCVDTTNSVYGARWVSGKLTLNLSGNSVASATGTVVVYFFR